MSLRERSTAVIDSIRKAINDTFGLDLGDLAIKQLAAIDAHTEGTADRFARLGGEEFVALSRAEKEERNRSIAVALDETE